MKLIPDMKKRLKVILAAVTVTAAVFVLLPIILHTSPSLPPGTNVTGKPVNVDEATLRLLIDETSWNAEKGQRVIRQKIFDEILELIDRADRFIYVDFFLWNPWQGGTPENHRKLGSELAAALIKKKRSTRGIDILVLSDPINRIYGGHEPEFFKDMSKAGIPVVFTDLDRLPDSNSLYAPYWAQTEKVLRSQTFSDWSSRPKYANPFDRGGPEISPLQLGRTFRFKANHRKVVIAGSVQYGLEMIIGSLNPADGSSAHSNLALAVRGKPVAEALRAELTAVRWSIEKKRNVIVGATSMASYKADSIEKKTGEILSLFKTPPGRSNVQWLTEGAIADTVIALLDRAGSGDRARIAMFYISHRGVIEALKGSILRGASVRLVLDANRDAFGMKKIGVPNRPVAAELMKLSNNYDIAIRWADTNGEQFHTKAMSISYGGTGEDVFITGSANWTRRNIGNLNMEANVVVRNAPALVEQFNVYFDNIWSNSDGLSHTLPYEAWEENWLKRFVKTRIYRFQERFGAGTF